MWTILIVLTWIVVAAALIVTYYKKIRDFDDKWADDALFLGIACWWPQVLAIVVVASLTMGGLAFILYMAPTLFSKVVAKLESCRVKRDAEKEEAARRAAVPTHEPQGDGLGGASKATALGASDDDG